MLQISLVVDVQREALTQSGVPSAVCYEGNAVQSNPLFLNIVGSSEEDLKNSIMGLLRAEFHFETWDDFIGYLMLNMQIFSHVFYKNTACFCLYARALHKTVFLWIETIPQHIFEPKEIQAVVDLCPFPLWYRHSDGEIKYCNDAYAGIFGKNQSKVLEDQVELIPKERAKSLYHQSQKAIDTQKIIKQQSHIIVRGERRFVEMGIMPCGIHGSVGYVLDLNDLDLLQKEKKFLIEGQKEIFEHLSTAVAIYSQDGKLVFFNRAYVNCFQFDENWLLMNPGMDEILEDLRSRRKIPEVSDFPEYKKKRLSLFCNLHQPLQEVSHYPDGRMLRMTIVPYKLGGLMYLFDDMSEALTLQSRYNTLIAVQNETIDNLFEGVLVFGPDHKLQLLNASFCKMMRLVQKDVFLGKSLKECLGSPFFLPVKSLMTSKSDGQTTIQTLYQQCVHLFDNRRIDECMVELDDKRLLRVSYSPLPDGSHLLSVVDMTDTTRFQGRLKERNLILEEQAFMRSYFIKDIFHMLSLLEKDIESGSHKGHLIPLVRTLLDIADSGRGPLTLVEEDIVAQEFYGILNDLCNLRTEKNTKIFLETRMSMLSFRGDQKILLQGLWYVLSRLFDHCGDHAVLHFLMDEKGDHVTFCLSMSPFIWKEQYTIGVNSQSFFPEKEGAHTFYEKECGIPFLRRVIELHGGCVQVTWPNTDSQNLFLNISLPCHGQKSEDDYFLKSA